MQPVYKRWLWLSGMAIAAIAQLSACGDDGESSGGGKSGSGGKAGSAGKGGTGLVDASGGGGGSGTGGSDAGDASDGGSVCGNGIVEGAEQCDDGNLTSGDGCQNTCSFTCTTDSNCDDSNACNGSETCNPTTHACTPGTPLNPGAACGANGELCVGGNCQLPSCGDAQLQTGEECDDGNALNGDGCDACKFSCVSTDAARNCSNRSGNECVSGGTCNDTTHVCSAGSNVTDGSACNSGQGTCRAGVCVPVVCGNGTREGNEQCDDGNAVETDGCKANCTFSCALATDCNDNNSCTGNQCNTTSHVCSNPPDTAQNGQACTSGTTNGTCDNGICRAASCGDSVIQSGEECDLGSQSGVPGSGCTATCQFECDTDPNCADANACNGAESCAAVTGGRTCRPGTNAARGTACGTNQICNGSGLCVNSVCGDGFVDSGRGEQCDPPAPGSCDSACRTIQPVVCGDGRIGGTEQCDDGNTQNLDGCDSSCKYEVIQRLTDVDIVSTMSPTWCTPRTNRFGTSVIASGIVLNILNTQLQDGIASGGTNILVQFLGLDDLTGTADSTLELGVMSGALDPAKGAWPGNNPIDWWFRVDPSTVASNGLPTARITPASIAARAVQGGPSSASLTLSLAGSPARLGMRDASIRGAIGASTSVPAAPPNALASGLTVFNTTSATGAAQGLCGNITVESLAAIPIPQSLAQGGSNACVSTCGRTYTYCGANQPVGPNCNSLLDAVVGGCGVQVVVCLSAINGTPTPDVAGSDGDADLLTLGPNNKVPASQTTGNDDGYSSYMTFTSNRAHITGRQ